MREKYAIRAVLLTAMLAFACAPEPVQFGSCGDPCTKTADCAAPFYCQDGRCNLDASYSCEAGKKRCNGGAVEYCEPPSEPDKCAPGAGLGWKVIETCPGGCAENACRPPTCVKDERRCDGKQVWKCTDGYNYAFVEDCATSCDDATHACVP